jgi:hypothetical protein
VIRTGNVADYIPELSSEDSVHVCGPLPLEEAVSRIADAADAPCYCVPFVPQHGEEQARENTLSRALDWFSGAKHDAIVTGDTSRRAPSRGRQDRRKAM